MNDIDKARKNQTPKGRNSKGKILDMAEKVFAEKGFVAGSIKDVIQGLGISAGALYHHFPSKKALLSGLARRSMNNLCDLMDAWLDDQSLSPGAKMGRFLDAIDDRRLLKSRMALLEIGLGREDGEIHEMVVATGLEPISERLTRYIELGNETREFSVPSPRASAVLVFLLTSEYMHRSRQLQVIVPADELNKTFRASIRLLLNWQ